MTSLRHRLPESRQSPLYVLAAHDASRL